MASQPGSAVKMAVMSELDPGPVDKPQHYPSTTALQPSMGTHDAGDGLTTEPRDEPAIKVVTTAEEILDVDDATTSVVVPPSQLNIDNNEPGETIDPAISPKESAEEIPPTPQEAARRQQTPSPIPSPIPSTPSRPTEAICHSHSSFTIQISTLCPGEQGEGTVTAPKRPHTPSAPSPTSPSALNTISIDFHLPQCRHPHQSTPFSPIRVIYQFHAPSPPPHPHTHQNSHRPPPTTDQTSRYPRPRC
ncbi:hypothetical protein F4814DRAFT_326824 [Daldinia grandis]|nr:hypothetical protein F4814DRAFT_326824 [Daldinia grandis]